MPVIGRLRRSRAPIKVELAGSDRPTDTIRVVAIVFYESEIWKVGGCRLPNLLIKINTQRSVHK